MRIFAVLIILSCIVNESLGQHLPRISPNISRIKRASKVNISNSQVVSSDTVSESSFRKKRVPDTCKVGIFVIQITDLDYQHLSYNTDFWMWFLTKSDSLSPLSSVTISNAKDYLMSQQSIERKADWVWSSQECKATINKTWRIGNFPFDHQRLKIIIEEAQRDTQSLVYIADSLESKISKNLVLDGWRINRMTVRSVTQKYETNYGDPTLHNGSAYPSIEAVIELHRDGFGLFLKMFIGVYVAFLISMAAFFFNSGVDARFSLAVGALFAAVANKYIADSYLPPTVQFTLVDKVHAVTFIFILLTIFISVFEMLHSRKTGSIKAKVFDRYAVIGVMLIYFSINGYFILNAIW
jgi:hypothetical protein